MKTIVISAFPACGKSYLYNNYNGKPFTMLDSDSSKFSWIYKDGVKTDERNPNFIEDYMKHIKENIGKVDVIFVSSHKEVRAALREYGIYYVQIYPEISMKDEMLRRMVERGNDEKFIKFQEENFEKFVNEIEDEIKHENVAGIALCESKPYLSSYILETLFNPLLLNLPTFVIKRWWNDPVEEA